MRKAKDITTDLRIRYEPRCVLTIYERKNKSETYYPRDEHPRFHLESRPVLKDGTTGAARPVTKALISKIAATFKAEGEHIPHGAMPENILYADARQGHEKYIWWTPPGVRTLFFSEGLGMADGPYHMPGTIYMVKGTTLYVYAFHGRKPAQRKRLLYGPFFNYSGSHTICLGNATAKLPDEPTWEDILRHWETLFWNSVNSHTTCNPMKEGHNLTVALKDATDKPFDTTLLNESKDTLEDLLRT